MTNKIIAMTLCFMLAGMPALSHAEKKAFWVERDYKTNKIKRLVSQLYDKSKRTQAKKDLSNYGPDVLEYVIPLLNDKGNESVRIAALYIIGQVGDSSAEEVVVEKLRDPSRRVRKEAAKALSAMGMKDIPVVAYKEKKSLWVKRETGENKTKRLAFQLYDKRKRMDAQRNLAAYGKEATSYVVPLLEDKNNEFVRIAALRIIADVKDSSVEDQVIRRLRDRDTRVRQEAARTLSVIGTQKAVDPLKRLLNDRDTNVRFNALMALTKIAPKQEKELFITTLNDYDPRIRMVAIIALGKLKARDAVPYLSQLVQDYDPAVRMQLAKAFGRIGSKECLQPLFWLMGDPDPNVSILAVENISRLNIPEAETPLIEAAYNPDSRVASIAILSLGRRNSPKALEIAKENLDDEHMSVRLACIEVIGRNGDEGDRQMLEPLLEAESSQVRQKAREVLQR
ncbi:MAG: HEAT repeat domain-containing protein [Candidatus Omnitrophota bacterium]